ncbi:MAG: hypothetical protein AAB116_20105, partial [Candidatus Poribacteria bacterium]
MVIHVLFFLTIINQAFCDFAIVQNGKPVCSIIIPKNPSEQEKFAINELSFFIDKFTGIILEPRSDANSLPSGKVILIGTYETNRYMNDLY